MPSGLHATAYSQSVGSPRVYSRRPVCTSHTFTARSADTDASRWPSGWKASPYTVSLWSFSSSFGAVTASPSFGTSQTRITRSYPADASNFPSGENASE